MDLTCHSLSDVATCTEVLRRAVGRRFSESLIEGSVSEEAFKLQIKRVFRGRGGPNTTVRVDGAFSVAHNAGSHVSIRLRLTRGQRLRVVGYAAVAAGALAYWLIDGLLALAAGHLPNVAALVTSLGLMGLALIDFLAQHEELTAQRTLMLELVGCEQSTVSLGSHR